MMTGTVIGFIESSYSGSMSPSRCHAEGVMRNSADQGVTRNGYNTLRVMPVSTVTPTTGRCTPSPSGSGVRSGSVASRAVRTGFTVADDTHTGGDELPHLHTFSVAAELSSFTKAAKALGLTQAAVSQRIQSLEQSLDTSLFDRRGGRVTLTE